MKSISANFRKIQLPSAILFIGTVISIAWSIYFSLVTISIPYQIEYREGTAQVLTGFFLKRQNPFILENQPLAMNNYGLGYNLIVLPFAAVFGNTLSVHRSVTFGFVLLSASLGFFIVHKKTGNNPLALACAAFITIGLVGNGGIGAFPAALGTFLFLVAIFTPFLRSFDLAGLIVSILASLMAFYTKPYFLLAFGIVLSYLFLFVSKRKSILYGLGFFTFFIPLLFAANYIFPLYFINTIIGNASNAYLTFNHLFAQLKELFFLFYPTLFLVLIFLFTGFFKSKPRKYAHLNKAGNIFNFSKWSVPVISYPFHFILYSFTCSFLAFLFVLGPHIGNYMNYAYQLLIPTFFSWFFQEITFKNNLKYALIVVVVVVSNLFIWSGKVLSPDMLKQKDSKEWRQVFDYIHASSLTLNSPALTSEIVALGQTPSDSGQTAYFYAVKPFSGNLLTRITYPKFQNDGIRYKLLINRMIKEQRYDLITTTSKFSFYQEENISNYYFQFSEVKLEMPQTNQLWTLEIWKPLLK